MQTMAMQPFRITVLLMGPLAVTYPRMAMPGAINADTGMATISAATIATITMVIVVVTIEIQGQKNWAAPACPFFAKVMHGNEYFCNEGFLVPGLDQERFRK